MSAAPVGTRVHADVRGRCPDPQSAVQERIFNAKPEREGVARLRMEHVFHYDPVRLARRGGPGDPADEAVYRVAAFRLVQRELVVAPIELVATVLQPVRPRDQRLTPARGAHLVSPISVDKLPTAGGVRAESPADLDDHSMLIAGYDLDLLSRWCDHGSPHVMPAARAFAKPPATEILFFMSACWDRR